jgi:hypothetical protein
MRLVSARRDADLVNRAPKAIAGMRVVMAQIGRPLSGSGADEDQPKMFPKLVRKFFQRARTLFVEGGETEARIAGRRVIRAYPYFSEKPLLPLEGVRLGFWALKEALPDFRVEDLRIIDVLRSAYFRSMETPLQGDERTMFIQRYDAALKEWRKLRDGR